MEEKEHGCQQGTIKTCCVAIEELLRQLERIAGAPLPKLRRRMTQFMIEEKIKFIKDMKGKRDES